MAEALNTQLDPYLDPNESAAEIARSLPEANYSKREIESIMLESQPVVTLRLTGGDGETIFASLEGSIPIVFKPKSGELGEYTQRNGYRHERAAYLVSEFLGLNIVPPTVVRKLNGEIGSAQQFVAGEPAYQYKYGKKQKNPDYQLSDEFKDELIKMWILDILIMNADRHRGNFIVTDNGEISAIDHGEAFSDSYSSMEEFFDVDIPQEIISRIEFLSYHTELTAIFEQHLGKVLSRDEIIKFQGRLKRMLLHFKENQTISAESLKGILNES